MKLDSQVLKDCNRSCIAETGHSFDLATLLMGAGKQKDWQAGGRKKQAFDLMSLAHTIMLQHTIAQDNSTEAVGLWLVTCPTPRRQCLFSFLNITFDYSLHRANC